MPAEATGRRRLALVLGSQGIRAPVRHFSIVNIWRSIAGPVEDTPLVPQGEGLSPAAIARAKDILRKNDPRATLFKDILTRALNSGSVRQRVQMPALAWNAFCEGRNLKIIKCIERV